MFAHSLNSVGFSHPLTDHLKNTAELARSLSAEFGAERLGYYAGLWHDLGKFSPRFQQYIAQPQGRRGPDHKSAGAVQAAGLGFDMLAWLVLGHHGGLPSGTDVKSHLERAHGSPEVARALSVAKTEVPGLDPAIRLDEALPPHLTGSGTGITAAGLKLGTEFFLRMLFSALVDADFLDTEHHFHAERTDVRAVAPSLNVLWHRFEGNQNPLSGKRRDELNQIRHCVYVRCLEAAGQEPGIFRLTVPTGGGKTLSAMGFALKHALAHGLRRVIVAVPYTSITEQTAEVYKGVFGEEAVLEHHSEATWRVEDTEDPTSPHTWARLASENWDAPIIVTTTVQLLESLFSNRPGRCRKLHNIAGSVVILDEVQTLPVGLLRPILDVLNELVAHYRVSVVLCSATLPAFQEEVGSFALRNVREIVPNPERLFQALHRVEYDLSQTDTSWPWERVAEEIRKTPSCMVIVNTKQDALQLLEALGDPDALHLSTLLCGAHRRYVLNVVRDRLAKKEPCRLVTTQVVEAGVDLDFPVVLRAMGPLDRIVQAAGRCNREGLLPGNGRVVVFVPEAGGLPRGAYETATAITTGILRHGGLDMSDPVLYRAYFRSLYGARDQDVKRIQNAREVLDFPEVAKRFRLIEDDTIPVVVRYPPECDRVDGLIQRLRSGEENFRRLIRRLQPYIVEVRRHRLEEMKQSRLVTELRPELYLWGGRYDDVRGLVGLGPEDLVV